MRLAVFRFRRYRALLRGSQIAPVNVAVLRFRVHDPRFEGIDRRVKSVAAVNHKPIFIGDAVACQRLARPAPASVVLQSAANVIGLFVVEANFIKLADGDGVDEIPRAPGVVAPMDSAVAAGEHVVRIRRIDPHRMKIPVDAPHAIRHEFLAAVLGVEHLRTEFPNTQIIIGIDANLAHLLPRLAFVFAAECSALFVLDNRVNDVRVLAVNIQADAPSVAAILVRQALRQFFPRRAAIGRFVYAAARPATVETEGCAAALIRRGVQNVRALRVHGDIAHASVVIYLQDLRPSLSAVRRLVDAALRIRPPQMALCRHVHHVGISRMNHNASDVMGRAQPHVLPGLSAVQRLVRAVAPRRTLPVVRLARSDPHDRGVGRRNRNVANRRHHVVPLLLVFHTPPEATPTKTMFGLLSTTAKSSMRPPITAGPISRSSRFFSVSVGFVWSAGRGSAPAISAPPNNPAADANFQANDTRFMILSLIARRGIILRCFPTCITSLWKQPGPVLKQTCDAAPRFRGPLHNPECPC